MSPPEGLSAPGRAAWKAAVATLVAIGESPEDCRGGLALYCGAVDVVHVVRRGWIALGRPALSTGSHGQPVAHPMLASIRDAERHALALGDSLLLTPSSRARARRGIGRPAGSATALDRRPQPRLRRVEGG